MYFDFCRFPVILLVKLDKLKAVCAFWAQTAFVYKRKTGHESLRYIKIKKNGLQIANKSCIQYLLCFTVIKMHKKISSSEEELIDSLALD